MSDKTKQNKWLQETEVLLPWAVALIGVIGIMVGFSPLFNINLPITPWSTAHGLDTIRAINEFSSGVKDTSPYHLSDSILAILSLVVLFVIGPSLWIFSEFKNQSKNGGTLKKGFVWYIGVMIVIAGLIHSVQDAIFKGYVFQNTWESAAKSKNANELRSHLNTLAFDAYEKYYLPQELGGGAKSFQSIPGEEGNIRDIKLADLEHHNPNTKKNYILAPVESDSTIKIYGIGFEEGPDPDFKNANGQQGKIQITVEVSPPGNPNYVNSNYN